MFVRPDERRFITAEMIRRTSFIGTAADLTQRIGALADAGFDQVVFSIPPGQEHAIEVLTATKATASAKPAAPKKRAVRASLPGLFRPSSSLSGGRESAWAETHLVPPARATGRVPILVLSPLLIRLHSAGLSGRLIAGRLPVEVIFMPHWRIADDLPQGEILFRHARTERHQLLSNFA